MLRAVLLIAPLLFAACAANAQVHRCGTSSVYTDRPCEGARAVDLRSNIMDAGPRQGGSDAAPVPAPAIIMPGGADTPKPAESSGSIWDRREARDAETRNRTGPYRP
ncbi:MAG TPA: hypothetical protein VHL79_02985 [Ramlibacter sp.]|jgi:hypothetical protein|nr:hypothetical protein [Ramlibacter sp.]